MSATKDRYRLLHRGAPDDPAQFAQAFLDARLRGFEKDMNICLKGVQSDDRPGPTHAYFPALTNCCGMLEYLAGLYAGRIDGIGKKEVTAYAKYLPQPDYNPEVIRVLFEAFRNAVAHRGIAPGMRVNPHPAMQGRRLTWRVFADTAHPALEVVANKGEIKFDSPWPCPYTDRVHIHLGRLWRDIRNSVDGYVDELVANKVLQNKFMKCIKQLYPK